MKVDSCCTPPGCYSQSPRGWPSQIEYPWNQFISVGLEKLDIKHIYHVKLNRFFFYLVCFMGMSFSPSVEGSRMENITFFILLQLAPRVMRTVSKYHCSRLNFKAICNLPQIGPEICHYCYPLWHPPYPDLIGYKCTLNRRVFFIFIGRSDATK